MSEHEQAEDKTKERRDEIKKQARNMIYSVYDFVGIPQKEQPFYLIALKLGVIAGFVSQIINIIFSFIAVRMIVNKTLSSLGMIGSMVKSYVPSALNFNLLDSLWGILISGVVTGVLLILIMRFVLPFWPKKFAKSLFLRLFIIDLIAAILCGGFLGIFGATAKLFGSAATTYYLLILAGNIIASLVGARIVSRGLGDKFPGMVSDLINK